MPQDDPVTLQPSYFAAINTKFDGPAPAWQYRATIAPNGDFSLHDCQTSADPDHCKIE